MTPPSLAQIARSETVAARVPARTRGTATYITAWTRARAWGVRTRDPAQAVKPFSASRPPVQVFLSYLRRRRSPDDARQRGIPATRTAIRAPPRFAGGGPEQFYITQLETRVGAAAPPDTRVPRARAAFSHAFSQIVIHGRPVKPALDAAARRVQRDLADHQYNESTER